MYKVPGRDKKKIDNKVEIKAKDNAMVSLNA
jgi:hypothetical protein